MTRASSPLRVLFLDYEVLDHMHRIDTCRYTGKSAAELTALRQAAVAGNIQVWMSRVTSVEMAIGLENPKLSPAQLSMASQNDEAKRIIANSMCVRWLTHPASKFNDTYSRANLTLRAAGPEWLKANALENQLLKLPGVSKGDARQVVSCVYGQAEDDGQQPPIWWFVSEDRELRTALTDAQAANVVSELVGLQVLSVKAFINSIANGQW
jgi:hypothetical protein